MNETLSCSDEILSCRDLFLKGNFIFSLKMRKIKNSKFHTGCTILKIRSLFVCFVCFRDAQQMASSTDNKVYKDNSKQTLVFNLYFHFYAFPAFFQREIFLGVYVGFP